MNLYVLLKMVPDTVEELNVSADGKSLDSEFLRFKLNDPDEHALEQALILKEKHGGRSKAPGAASNTWCSSPRPTRCLKSAS